MLPSPSRLESRRESTDRAGLLLEAIVSDATNLEQRARGRMSIVEKMRVIAANVGSTVLSYLSPEAKAAYDDQQEQLRGQWQDRLAAAYIDTQYGSALAQLDRGQLQRFSQSFTSLDSAAGTLSPIQLAARNYVDAQIYMLDHPAPAIPVSLDL